MIKVRDLMETAVITIPIGTVWRKAAQILLQNKISGAPVVDAENHVLGVVSEKDLFRSLFPSYQDWYQNPDAFSCHNQLEDQAKSASKERAVEEFMSKRLLTIGPETPVMQVGALMISTGIHRVPILEQGKLIGVISRRNVFRAILKESLGLGEDGKDI